MTQRSRPTPFRWLLLAALAAAALAGAQEGLPPPGTMSKQLPPGTEIYISFVVSDATQQISRNLGMSAVEARMRSKQECSAKASDCVEIANFPIRDHCMGMAVNKQAKPNVRAIFINTSEVGKVEDGALSSKSQAECLAAGGKQCVAQNDYCF